MPVGTIQVATALASRSAPNTLARGAFTWRLTRVELTPERYPPVASRATSCVAIPPPGRTFSAMPTPIIAPAFDLEACRARIPLLASLVPMNNCSQAPQTLETRAAVERYLASWGDRGMDWDAWMAEVQLAKQAFAA